MYLYHNPWEVVLQDGMFHKNNRKKLGKVRIDGAISNMLYLICWALSDILLSARFVFKNKDGIKGEGGGE